MAEKSINRDGLLEQLADEAVTLKTISGAYDSAALADACAEAIIALNADEVEPEDELVVRLTTLLHGLVSEKLRSVCIGTLWREDLPWLEQKDADGISARERLLAQVIADKPDALAAVFWRSVAERGPRFVHIAFEATRNIHRTEAARLLVKLGRAAVHDEVQIDIRSTVDGFLDAHDSSVRSAFLDAVKTLNMADRKALMSHLDISLMSELDKSAIEHRGKDFFYDADAEQAKRDTKSKDIFAEVARRLERGDKPE